MSKRPREDSPDPLSPESDYPTPESVDEASHWTKYIQTSNDTAPRKTAMKCSLPPHSETLWFSTFEEFEVHYAKAHAHRCLDCRKNFPTEHFLGLHIEENHNPLADAKRAKGDKTYRCFVEDCEKVCMDPHKRRMHLTDKHMFPKNYDFLIVNTGIDRKSSMLRSKHRKSASAAFQPSVPKHPSNTDIESLPADQDTTRSAPTDFAREKNDQEEEDLASPDKDLESLTSTMSALKFVPPSVRFGRGGMRGGLSRS